MDTLLDRNLQRRSRGARSHIISSSYVLDRTFCTEDLQERELVA